MSEVVTIYNPDLALEIPRFLEWLAEDDNFLNIFQSDRQSVQGIDVEIVVMHLDESLSHWTVVKRQRSGSFQHVWTPEFRQAWNEYQNACEASAEERY